MKKQILLIAFMTSTLFSFAQVQSVEIEALKQMIKQMKMDSIYIFKQQEDELQKINLSESYIIAVKDDLKNSVCKHFVNKRLNKDSKLSYTNNKKQIYNTLTTFIFGLEHGNFDSLFAVYTKLNDLKNINKIFRKDDSIITNSIIPELKKQINEKYPKIEPSSFEFNSGFYGLIASYNTFNFGLNHGYGGNNEDAIISNIKCIENLKKDLASRQQAMNKLKSHYSTGIFLNKNIDKMRMYFIGDNFAIIHHAINYRNQKSTSEESLNMTITLIKIDGTWKIFKLAQL